MRLPIAPTPSLWPTSTAGVLNVAKDWYDADRVAITPIENLPRALLDSIQPPAIGDTNLESAPTSSLSSAAAFAIAMNSINYRFWDKTEDGAFVRYENEGKVGAMAMTDAFQKAWSDPSSPLAQARDHHIPLTVADIATLFGPMPAPESRVAILNEVLLNPQLHSLAEQACDMLDSDQAFGTAFSALMAQAFPLAYGDEVLKKAQLATSAIWREARSHGYSGECAVTAFADYQIPNVLRALGVLQYAPELAERIDRMELIPVDGADERAIRAASILAVEQLADACGVSVADVDYWIWLKRKEPKTPFHLTDTTAY